uniref:Interleukin n=1 Tax=Electrophorus electricus TaxID=8005 RepID=A0A4W4HS71_ELEEL
VDTDVQFYVSATILFLYLIAVFLRQAKCLPVCSIEAVEMVKSFLKLHPMVSRDVFLYLMNYKMKTCPDCEVYKEEKAEIFLNTLLNVLQMMNSKDACSR